MKNVTHTALTDTARSEAMKHLIISREYPPAAYGPGGIGAYTHNIARLLAEAGETVHVIGQRWNGAPVRREESHGGRLVVHGSVQVIRLPIGHTSFIKRDFDTWERGSICYVGRLEPRKGVIEWVDAAVRVASETPAVAFDFIGADMTAGPLNGYVSMRRYLEARIPRAARYRFRFHGVLPQERLPRLLARARAAVVPSRWENFPNACIEAMCTGLPVIATRFGGMAEMVEDAVSGWLVDSDDCSSMVPGLTRALQRCLESTPEQLQAMGTAAVSSIRRLCDNRRTIEGHLAFRARIAHNGARSGKLSVDGVAARASGATHAACGCRQGIGIVVWITPAADGHALLESLKRQSREPAVLVVAGQQDGALHTQTNACSGRFLPVTTDGAGSAWNAAFAEASAAVSPVGWMFLDHNDRLQPDALERLEATLAERPDLGLVSCWTGIEGRPGQLCVSPNPGLPYQLLANDAARATAFRAEAIPRSAPFGTHPVRGAELWELSLQVLVDGWAAVTYPAMLAQRARDDIRLRWSEAVTFRERRVELVRRYTAALAEDLPALVDLYVPPLAEPVVVRSAWRRVRGAPLVRRLTRLISRPQRVGEVVQRRLRRLAGGSQFSVAKHQETPWRARSSR